MQPPYTTTYSLVELEILAAGVTNACGCTDELATNYDDSAEYDDGSCEYAVPGCVDATACNYNADATDDDGSCEYAADGYDCDGNCLADADGDGVCDEFEVAGCQDATACNYDADATDDDGSCTYADAATTATATASRMRTATAYAMSLKWRVARPLMRATMIRMRRTMTAAVISAVVQRLAW